MVVSLTVTPAPVSQDILEAGIKVLSNLSKMRLSNVAQNRDVTNKVSQTTSQIIEANFASNPIASID